MATPRASILRWLSDIHPVPEHAPLRRKRKSRAEQLPSPPGSIDMYATRTNKRQRKSSHAGSSSQASSASAVSDSRLSLDGSSGPGSIPGLDPDRTPRPGNGRHNMSYSRDNDSSTTGGSGRGAASPTKQQADLQRAAKPLYFRAFESLTPDKNESHAQLVEAWEAMELFGNRVGILPESARTSADMAAVPRIARFPNVFDQAARRETYGALPSPAAVRRIVAGTTICIERQHSEAVWNEEVHSRVLAAALRSEDVNTLEDGMVNYACCTSSRAQARYATSSSKMVDYCLFIDVKQLASRWESGLADTTRKQSEIASPSSLVNPATTTTEAELSPRPGPLGSRAGGNPNAIPATPPFSDATKRALLALQERDGGYGSVNHTTTLGLRDMPLCVSVESKRPGENLEVAKLQLAVWLHAQWQHLEETVQPQSESASGPGRTTRRLAFLPGLLVQGDEWYFVAATRDVGATTFWHRQSIGSTSTELGTYQIICAIQYLAHWARNTFWPWFRGELVAAQTG